MNAKAIITVLSAKLREGEMIVLDKFALKDNKTKEMAQVLKNLPAKGRMLVSFSTEEREMRKYSRNIENVNNILVEKLNVLDMLNNKNLIISYDSIKYLEEKYKVKA
jgi:large subunit ribosomal protein L4